MCLKDGGEGTRREVMLAREEERRKIAKEIPSSAASRSSSRRGPIWRAPATRRGLEEVFH
jgi:hypothetical protein